MRESKQETLSNYHEQQLKWISGQLRNNKNIFLNPERGIERWHDLVNPIIKIKTQERTHLEFHQVVQPDVENFVKVNLTDKALNDLVLNLRVWRGRGGERYVLQTKLDEITKSKLDQLVKKEETSINVFIVDLINKTYKNSI